MSQESQPTADQILPCRGCTIDCPNRERCDGKPWRIPREDRTEACGSPAA